MVETLIHSVTPRLRKPSLTRAARWAILAAILTMALKFVAYAITGSVSLLSDAVESSANLVAALTALFAVWYAARPVDLSHRYGHEKIEFFASGLEGILVLIAAGGIGWYAVGRLIDPRPLAAIDLGLAVSIAAGAINLGVARLLLRAARAHESVALEADGRHLMTDVWTSAGVIVGLLLVRLTGVERLDPIIALVVAVNILWTGISLIRTAVDGLMDRALSPQIEAAVRRAIEGELEPGEAYHALRTRQAGSRRFVDFHLLVPGEVSVQRAHEVSNRIEHAVESAIPRSETTVHVEPIEEPASWSDSDLLAIEEEVAADRSRPLDTDLVEDLEPVPLARALDDQTVDHP
ncbi:MAG: cation diffusion facilitator family transporter [Thermomicrobiales bacterium]